MNLSQTLLAKFNSNKLAHFYHLSNVQSAGQEEYFNKWISALLQSFINAKGLRKDVNQCGDIHFIKPEGNQYVLDDLKPIFKWQNYDPIELGQMFFILYDADKLTDLISNKLLKVLEEPHSNHTLILLNPKNTKLLPTIASRTINLRLPIPSEVTPIEINEIYTKGMSFHEFQNKNRAQEKQLLSILLNAQFEDFKALDALTNLMKTHQESLTYHHSAQTRMYLIYQFLEQHL